MARNPNYTQPSADAAERAVARKDFGDRLRVMMNQKHWTQSETARKTGIARDAISNYVRGNSFPDPANLQRLAKALGTQPEVLIPTMAALPARQRRAAPVAPPVIADPEFSVSQIAPDRMEVRLHKTLSSADAAKIMAIITH